MANTTHKNKYIINAIYKKSKIYIGIGLYCILYFFVTKSFFTNVILVRSAEEATSSNNITNKFPIQLSNEIIIANVINPENTKTAFAYLSSVTKHKN